MKSIIVLTLMCVASAGAFAKPILPAHAPAFDTTFFDIEHTVQTGLDLSATQRVADLLEDRAMAPTNGPVQILSGDGSELTYRRRPSYDKYCRSSQRNAWGLGGRCYERDDNSQSVPEPGTLVLLGTGLLLMAWRRKRQVPIPFQRNA